jgi:hypothetical protein
MEAYEFEMTPEDMGEIIEIIRVQHLRMNDEVFCDKMKISPKLLFTVEQGKGPHGAMVLRKIHKTFSNINVKMSVEIG